MSSVLLGFVTSVKVTSALLVFPLVTPCPIQQQTHLSLQGAQAVPLKRYFYWEHSHLTGCFLSCHCSPKLDKVIIKGSRTDVLYSSATAYVLATVHFSQYQFPRGFSASSRVTRSSRGKSITQCSFWLLNYTSADSAKILTPSSRQGGTSPFYKPLLPQIEIQLFLIDHHITVICSITKFANLCKLSHSCLMVWGLEMNGL